MRLQALLSDSGVDPRELADIFQVTDRTVRLWLKSQNFPAHVRAHLQLAGGHYPGWEGFKIRPGVIVLPTGDTVCKDQLRQFHLLSGMVYTESRIAESWKEKSLAKEDEIAEKLYIGAEAIIKQLLDHLRPRYINHSAELTAPPGVTTTSESEEAGASGAKGALLD